MIIEKIKLNNIRSFIDEEIEFPLGTTLLAGDIGSGKTSVLLAIDFALFGIRRGTLSGSALLRNNTDNGYVELKFKVDDKEIIIKRTLKRSKDTVLQDSGFITINNEKRELTPQELKQAILELINYPQEMLTRYKDLIYRYTVYTPQEEMKKILYEKKEDRIDTLRKVFGIDKYKRIKDNLKIFSSKIREKNNEIRGKIYNLDYLKENKKLMDEKINELNNEIKTLNPSIEEFNTKINSKRNEIKSMEEEIEKLNELKKQLEVLEIQLNNKVDRRKEIRETLDNLESNIKELREDLKEEIKDIGDKLDKREIKLEELRSKVNNFNQENSSLKTKIIHSEDIMNKIKNLDNCPICKQKVTNIHRKVVIGNENNNLKEFNDLLNKNNNFIIEIDLEIRTLNEEINLLRESKTKYQTNLIKKKNLEEKENTFINLNNENNNLKKEIGEINLKKPEIFSAIEKREDLRENYNKEKEGLENLNLKLKELEVKKATLDTEVNNKSEELSRLIKDIEEKEILKLNLNKLSILKEFIDKNLTSLMDLVERQIMLRLHYDFNELFEKWFNILIENDNITIKLDEEFTPLISLSHHDIDYEYLSGGEKTAAALAYRLSLNQVINNLMSKIKTNDLIILDEPTDGFSYDQLDRMKLILDELDIKQIIIVSHEPKIESFVENVLRFNKEDHSSKVSKY